MFSKVLSFGVLVYRGDLIHFVPPERVGLKRAGNLLLRFKFFAVAYFNAYITIFIQSKRMHLDDLVVRFQKKDVQAFEQLYNLYAENICGVINAIVQNSALAEEICQDVFVKIWNRAASYNSSKGRFFTWILNIARNAAIDELRSKSHKNQKLNLSTEYFVGILENPEDGEENSVNIEHIGRFINKLKQKCIELIDLLYFKGYTQKEVSETLNIPVGTVKTRNRSCISQLRENMKNT
ncbi:MAG: RNA polymerase sigma factor [Allomuricauda sp.]